jgi:hypothetical protein
MRPVALSCRLWHGAQHEKLRRRTGYEGIRASFVIAELDENSLGVERLNDRADLTGQEAGFGALREQRHRI